MANRAAAAVLPVLRSPVLNMKIGSLFSGYGGLDRAVMQAFPGSTVAWHCEFDKAPSAILAHHYPNVPNLGDVTKIDWSAIEPVDIIAGGYPCQPFSAAGRRQGQKDDRHMWPAVVECMSILNPKMAVFENVRGHLSLGFDEVLRDLHFLGYDVDWTTIKASDIGAPHHRARIFILAQKREENNG